MTETRLAEIFFQATNTLALLAWIPLVLFPGRKAIASILCGFVVPAMLAVAYAAVIVCKLAGNGPPPGDVMTLGGLRDVFRDDFVFAAAWTHYLAFDMVVGAWIARESVRLGIFWPLRTVSLVLTFLAGPVGFLVHLAGRGFASGSSSAFSATNSGPNAAYDREVTEEKRAKGLEPSTSSLGS